MRWSSGNALRIACVTFAYLPFLKQMPSQTPLGGNPFLRDCSLIPGTNLPQRFLRIGGSSREQTCRLFLPPFFPNNLVQPSTSLPNTEHLLAPWTLGRLLNSSTCWQWHLKLRGHIIQGNPIGVGSKHQEQLFFKLASRWVVVFFFCERELCCGALRNATHGKPERTHRKFTSSYLCCPQN